MLSRHMTIIVTGIFYFAIIFTFAFAMGIARVLFIAPRLGATAAVSLEIPVVLTASWFMARRLVRDRTFTLPQLISIGAIAFALTMVSEAVLAAVIQGQSVTQWATTLATPLGIVGLAGQVAFAIIPALQGVAKNQVRKT